MRYQSVCVETFAHLIPPHVQSSDDIESQLQPVYDRLGLPAGRLELMSGIRERRYWPAGTRPGEISAQCVTAALQKAGIDPGDVGALIHGSVCRDQLEPATAAAVHYHAGLPGTALVLDLSNACLGLLNGMLMIADLIELERIRCGVVVGTELGHDLVTGTIDTLLSDPNTSRQDVKRAFASLTIGSGSAAVVLTHRRFSRQQHRLLGGVYRADTAQHALCAGGVQSETFGDDRPRMQTDSEALLHAGVNLAEVTWRACRDELAWSNADVTKAVTHQVGRAHRKLLYERLELDPGLDFPSVEFLGNTGAAALPLTASLAADAGHFVRGDKIALLGIGSGLNSVMLGLDW